VVTDPDTHMHTNTPTDRTDYNTLARSVIKFVYEPLGYSSVIDYFISDMTE